MDKIKEFKNECKERISENSRSEKFLKASRDFMEESTPLKYSYNFTWMGRPIIQYPQDIIAMQELIWDIKPDLIIETGIAHGGSLLFYASILELIGGEGQILGIDIDIREHNRKEIENHPMYKRVSMIQGSSIEKNIVDEAFKFAEGKKNIMVVLDSNHTHEHVLKELEYYSPLVTKGSYLIVFDTIIGFLPDGYYPDRPWDKKDNPHSAVREFLKKNSNFEVDKEIDNKLMLSVAYDGYLKRI